MSICYGGWIEFSQSNPFVTKDHAARARQVNQDFMDMCLIEDIDALNGFRLSGWNMDRFIMFYGSCNYRKRIYMLLGKRNTNESY